MAYTIRGASVPADEPENTIREYWQRSFGGRYIKDFENGYAAGRADIEQDSFDGLYALRAVLGADRGTAWDAGLDGYREAVQATRGPLFHIGD